MKINSRIVAESIIKDLYYGILNEDQNPVVNQEEKTKVSDFIQYYTKPGIIIALVKGETETGVQQIPIGAVDNFRFMRVTDESAIQKYKDIANETESNQTYEEIQKEYELSKNEVVEQWKKHNLFAYESLQKKYGDRLLGTDIIQNDKKIIHKDEDGKIAKNEVSDKGRSEEELSEIDQENSQIDGDNIQEGFLANVATKTKNAVKGTANAIGKGLSKVGNAIYDTANNPFANNGIKAFVKASKTALDNNKEEEITLHIKITNGNAKGEYPVVDAAVIRSQVIKGLTVKGNALCLCYAKSGDAVTLTDFREGISSIKIDGKPIDQMTRSFQGMGIYTEDKTLLKEADEEETSSTTFEPAKSESGDKIALQTNKFEQIQVEGSKIVISFSQTEEQQKNQDKNSKFFS